jgi:glucans biosynthesis protein
LDLPPHRGNNERPRRRPEIAGGPVLSLITRRSLIAGLAAGVAVNASRAAAAAPPLGPARSFSFAALDAQARADAQRPFTAPTTPWAKRLEELDYDAIGEIRYRPEAALWAGDQTIGSVEFFHPSRFARGPVSVHVVQAGQAREVLYNPALFDIPVHSPARGLPREVGFAGFRVMNPHTPGDWIAYVGASYFRSADPFNQYGLSARGLALDTAAAGPEQFPTFSSFWLERLNGQLVVYARLDGPSVTGAYRIGHRRGPDGLVQDIDARLYFRSPVERLGLAPLTSMFWYGPASPSKAGDWRPQIHDSDGLSIWTGAGERIWRPLGNPPRVVTNTFSDENPRGFGLMQRDRAFADYQDDGAFYDRRPSAWVEPVGPWGKGSVQLVEIPTDGETDDNIVAFWTPARPVHGGDALSLRYRLYWTASEPTPPGVAQVVATRIGRGGRPGTPAPPGIRKYVVDFDGGRLASLDRHSGVLAEITVSRGRARAPTAYPVVGTRMWRLTFDVDLAPGQTLDLRAYLRLGDEALTETWIAQAFG